MRWIFLLSVVAACSKRNQEVCCETADECAAIGTQEVVACSVGVCVEHECVDIGSCDGDEDCELPETCVQSECTPPPPPPDAALNPAFDVAYGGEWNSSINAEIPFSIVIINTDVRPLSMATLEVRQLNDDHPTAFIRFRATPSTASIPPGFAGGAINGDDQQELFDSGLITEEPTDTKSAYLTIEPVDAPDGIYDIAIDAKLALDGIEFPLQLTIHRVPFPPIRAEIEVAKRVSFFR